jgi:CubicO group peptidase (beta-lactamase class C family)
MGSAGTYSWGGFYYTYFWVDPKEDLVGIWMAQLYPWGDLTLWDDFRKLTYAALEGSGRGMEVREEKAAPTP